MATKIILFLALCLLLVVVSVLTVSQDPVEVGRSKSRFTRCQGRKSGVCEIAKVIVKLGQEVYEFFMQIVKGGCWPGHIVITIR